MPETWSAFLHLLVFVYWLGGDAGAFTASFTLTDGRQTPAARLAAARILNHVDMAPRSALILTLPTGLTLATQRNWIEIQVEALLLIWIVSALWLAALWVQHVKHLQSKLWRNTDLFIRSALIAGSLITAWLTPPLFLKIKFTCLALAAALGIAIRFAIAPLGPALAQLTSGHSPTEAGREIANALSIGRPLVVCIWMCLLIAAWAGVAKPI